MSSTSTAPLAATAVALACFLLLLGYGAWSAHLSSQVARMARENPSMSLCSGWTYAGSCHGLVVSADSLR